MGGMGLIFTPALVRCFLRPISLVWAYDWHFLNTWLLQTVQLEGLTCLRLPTRPSTHPTSLPLTHPLIHAIHDITVVVKKVAQNSAVLASYYR